MQRAAYSAHQAHPPHVQKRLNLTKTVKKTPINLEMERQGAAVDETNLPVPKYDEDGALVGGPVHCELCVCASARVRVSARATMHACKCACL